MSPVSVNHDSIRAWRNRMDDARDSATVSLRVNGDEWRRVRSLAEAGPDDEVFLFDAATGRVSFGDGTHGKAPARGDSITVSYRQGSGGNVPLSIATPSTRRVRIFSGQLLSAGDFQDEQRYHLEMRRRLNRALHGWGIVEGLGVTTGGTAARPTVVVEPGLALDASGREIEVTAHVELDVPESDRPWYVVVRYKEAESDFTPAAGRDQPIATRVEERASIHLSSEEESADGVVIGRLHLASNRCHIDRSFVIRRAHTSNRESGSR